MQKFSLFVSACFFFQTVKLSKTDKAVVFAGNVSNFFSRTTRFQSSTKIIFSSLGILNLISTDFKWEFFGGTSAEFDASVFNFLRFGPSLLSLVGVDVRDVGSRFVLPL